MAKVIIFGTGTHAINIYFHLIHDSPNEVVAFTIDDHVWEESNSTLYGLPVVPFSQAIKLYSSQDYKMCVAISYRNVNKLRAQKYDQVKSYGYELISYISTRARVWPDVEIGDNTLIFDDSHVLPCTKIGCNVTLATGSIISHHAEVREHSYIAANAVVLGSAIIEPFVILGANSTVNDRVVVARECIIDSGVTIHKSTLEKGVYLNQREVLLQKRSDELSNLLSWPR